MLYPPFKYCINLIQVLNMIFSLKQESRAAARKLHDAAAAILFGFNCHVVSFSLQFL